MSAALTSLDVGFNNLDEEAALGIVRAARQQDKMKTLGLAKCGIGASGAQELADYMRVSALTKVLAFSNLRPSDSTCTPVFV